MANTPSQTVIAAKLGSIKQKPVIKLKTGDRGTTSVIGQALSNLGARFNNNIKNKISYVKLAPLRLQRNLQKKLGVEKGQLIGAFPELYEWERRNPKKTKAISQIQRTQERDRKDMEDTSKSSQVRAVSCFTEMIKEIIISMLCGTTHKDALDYHNNKNKDYKIDQGSEMDNLIRRIFPYIKECIRKGTFDASSIDTQLNVIIKQHSSINGKTNDQLKTQVESIIKQQEADKNLAQKGGSKAVNNQKRNDVLKKDIESGAMGNNNAFGSTFSVKSEKQSKNLIKDTTKKGASSASTAMSNAKKVLPPICRTSDVAQTEQGQEM